MNFTKLDTDTNNAESVMKRGPVPDIVNDPVYTQFNDLWKNFRGDGSTEGTKKTLADIQSEQDGFDKSSRGLLTYLADDYRGEKWVSFNPECLDVVGGAPGGCSAAIRKTRDQINAPVDAIEEVAKSQGDLDVLINWGAYLHKTYDGGKKVGGTTYTDPAMIAANIRVLQWVDVKIDAAKALVSVLNDGVTALKASQTALRTAYLAAAKLQEDFAHRLGMRVGKIPATVDGEPAEQTAMINEAKYQPAMLHIDGANPGELFRSSSWEQTGKLQSTAPLCA